MSKQCRTFVVSKRNNNNLKNEPMRIKLKLRNGKRTVTVELEVRVRTLFGLLKEKEALLMYNQEVVKDYLKAGYYVTGVEDIDHEKKERNIHIQGHGI